MRFNSDRLHWHTTSHQLLEQFNCILSRFFILLSPLLDSIDIQHPQSLWISFRGCVKGGVNVSWSEKIQPDTRIDSIAPLGPRHDRFIHNIPGANPARIPSHHRRNMLSKKLCRIGTIKYRLEPSGIGQWTIPTEIVTVYLHTVLLSKVYIPICFCEIVRIRHRVNSVPFHAACRKEIEIADHQLRD